MTKTIFNGKVCQSHEGQQCDKDGIPWNIRTEYGQVLQVILCKFHKEKENYS